MKLRLIGIIIIVAMILGGCSGSPLTEATASSKTEFVLRLGHLQGENHPYHKGALKFKELVEKRSQGRIRIDIFPNSQLGNGRDQIEGVQLGSIHFHIGSVAPITNFAPKFNVLNLPYLFENREHAFRVLDGEIGREIAKGLEEKGIINLAYMENGWRHLTNNKVPIKTAEDVKGLKIRVQESPPYIAFMNVLNATPVPIPFGELYTALEQKVVDGQENPLAQISLNKFNEVQSYLTLTAHNYDAAVFLTSKIVVERMPKDLQQVILESAKEAAEYEREVSMKEESKYLDELKKSGMNIEENPDLDSFREAVRPVYKQFEKAIGKDLIERIEELK